MKKYHWPQSEHFLPGVSYTSRNGPSSSLMKISERYCCSPSRRMRQNKLLLNKIPDLPEKNKLKWNFLLEKGVSFHIHLLQIFVSLMRNRGHLNITKTLLKLTAETGPPMLRLSETHVVIALLSPITSNTLKVASLDCT